MKIVGIKELKAKLSGYVNEVREGNRILVKDRTEEVAIITPLSSEYRAIRQLMKLGKAQWSFGKPRGLSPRVPVEGAPVSSTVLEERE
jgi:prevent-host-death family protein